MCTASCASKCVLCCAVCVCACATLLLCPIVNTHARVNLRHQNKNKWGKNSTPNLTFQPTHKHTHTHTGGLTQPKQAKSVIGLFRRESSGSGGVVIGGVTDSETSTPVAATTPVGRMAAVPKDKRSASIAGYITIDGGDTACNPMLDPLGISRAGPHATAFPVTASHRRNNRRGSMLELSG